jgi:ribonucleoside-diphosphate reductase alpha chain
MSKGPQVAFSDELHAQKYRGKGETFTEAMNRIAGALKDDEAHFRLLQDLLQNQRFLPGGRVQASMGAIKTVSPINCYMSGDIFDSFVHGYGNIMQRATEAASTMRLGGGIGTNFSTLRPNGANIKKLDSSSSGPVSFMHIFDSVGRAIASSGHRRGAQMGVLRVDHPDIEEFIHAKNNTTELTGFNMSILATDEFMRAVELDLEFDLRFDGEVYRTVRARSLWEMIMRSTYDYAEPGVIFIDRIHEENNLSYCETITGTNPCGEIPLPPYGACLLGSFNLVKYVDLARGEFETEKFLADIPVAVRALDNVIDRASVWPLVEQEDEMKNKRRIGIGITGLANALEALGAPYGSKAFVKGTEFVMRTLRDEAYRASIDLAIEKGSFPMLDADKFLSSGFAKRLPEEIRQGIREHGIRNSHLLAIAPTGTISLTADNVSSGLEPVFAHRFNRVIHLRDGQRTESVEDYAVRVFSIEGKTAEELSPMEHLDVLAACQPFVDQSISKTINVPTDIAWEDFKDVYLQAWKRGAKGCTTFRPGGLRGGILVKEDEEEPQVEEGSACGIDPQTGRRECA